MMDDDVVIRVTNVSKSFRIDGPKKGRFRRSKIEHNVFHDLNLEVRKGEVVGVIGKNGCGKSTFLKLVSEVLDPDTGSVEVRGNVASILELSMGFHPDLTGRENVIIRSELYRMNPETKEQDIEKIIAYSDLGEYIDNPIRTYSSGMRSRLAFSVMVNVDADIYIIDEALSTGDMAFASKASEHLKNLVRSGKTVLFTSHSLSTVKRTCERAIWLYDHTIYMDGPVEDVCDAYSRSVNDSFEETLSLAEGGSSSAQYRLATFYRDGVGTEADQTLYRKWLEDASLREHPLAMQELADLLMGEGRDDEAEVLYKKAADNGNYDAKLKYQMSRGTAVENIEALRQVTRDLAESGYPPDLFNHGQTMFKSASRPSDYQEAFEFTDEAQAKGWLDADVLLQQMYREGKGVQRSMEKSLEILRSSAGRGNAKAMQILGNQYYDGKLMERNYEEQFKWYLMSAMAGNPKSQYQVAYMLSKGEGTEKDEDAAEQWFERYADQMLNDCRRNALETLKKRSPSDPRINGLLRAAQESRDIRSIVQLAGKYSSGKRINQDKSISIRMLEDAAPYDASAKIRLQKLRMSCDEPDGATIFGMVSDAAQHGNADAMYHLAMFYKDGTYCEEDVKMYQMYMRMAAERGNTDARAIVQSWNRRIEKRKRKQDSGDRDDAGQNADAKQE